MNNIFEISTEQNTVGFQEHYTLSPIKSVRNTLKRRFLPHENILADLDRFEVKKIIDHNSSLRVSFNWSFESVGPFKRLIDECMDAANPNYSIYLNGIVSDISCNWIGFKPYNVFERVAFEGLSNIEMILFNNELISYQIDILERIQRAQLYLDHAILRDDNYRFEYFKNIRQDEDKLVDGFHYIMSSINNTLGIYCLDRTYIEELIGCHYLHHPNIFFEMVTFYLLSGRLHD